jgi:hypothetical protein
MTNENQQTLSVHVHPSNGVTEPPSHEANLQQNDMAAKIVEYHTLEQQQRTLRSRISELKSEIHQYIETLPNQAVTTDDGMLRVQQRRSYQSVTKPFMIQQLQRVVDVPLEQATQAVDAMWSNRRRKTTWELKSTWYAQHSGHTNAQQTTTATTV